MPCMKKISCLFFSLFVCFAFCFPQKIGVLKGPSGIPSAYLMENFSDNAEYEVFSGANFLLPKLIKGEVEIGFLPPNVAAKVYNANKGAALGTVCGIGVPLVHEFIALHSEKKETAFKKGSVHFSVTPVSVNWKIAL